MLKTKKILSVLLSLVMIFGIFSVVACADSVVVIDSAEITIDTNVAGVDAEDYESYISILTEGLEFEDNYGDPAVFVVDEEGIDFDGKFAAGETYYFFIYLSPESGCVLADEVAGTVNGEEISTYIDSWEPGEEYGEITVDYVCLEYEITVEGEPEVEEINWFKIIINFILSFIELVFGAFA